MFLLSPAFPLIPWSDWTMNLEKFKSLVVLHSESYSIWEIFILQHNKIVYWCLMGHSSTHLMCFVSNALLAVIKSYVLQHLCACDTVHYRTCCQIGPPPNSDFIFAEKRLQEICTLILLARWSGIVAQTPALLGLEVPSSTQCFHSSLPAPCQSILNSTSECMKQIIQTLLTVQNLENVLAQNITFFPVSIQQ